RPDRRGPLSISRVRARQVGGAVLPLILSNLVGLELAVRDGAGGRVDLGAGLVRFSLRAVVWGSAWVLEGSVPLQQNPHALPPEVAELRGRSQAQSPRRHRRPQAANVPRCPVGSVSIA